MYKTETTYCYYYQIINKVKPIYEKIKHNWIQNVVLQYMITVIYMLINYFDDAISCL